MDSDAAAVGKLGEWRKWEGYILRVPGMPSNSERDLFWPAMGGGARVVDCESMMGL